MAGGDIGRAAPARHDSSLLSGAPAHASPDVECRSCARRGWRDVAEWNPSRTRRWRTAHDHLAAFRPHEILCVPSSPPPSAANGAPAFWNGACLTGGLAYWSPQCPTMTTHRGPRHKNGKPDRPRTTSSRSSIPPCAPRAHRPRRRNPACAAGRRTPGADASRSWGLSHCNGRDSRTRRRCKLLSAGQGGGIRTHDLLLPRQVRYRTALHPVPRPVLYRKGHRGTLRYNALFFRADPA